MRRGNQILTEFYKLCKTKGLDVLVADGIHKIQHSKAGKEYIEMWMLANNGRAYVQEGYINLNLFIESLADGRPNLSRIDTLTDSIHLALKSEVTEFVRFQIEQESGVIPDKLQDKMFFINFKINFQTI